MPGITSSTFTINAANLLNEQAFDAWINKMNLKNVKIKYTGGDVGWAGDIRMVRFNTDKIKSFGWKAEYTSQQAIEKSVELMLGE